MSTKKCLVMAGTVWLATLAMLLPSNNILLYSSMPDEPGTGSAVIGIVKNPSGQAIAGAQVTLTAEGSGVAVRAVTDQGGAFAFRSVSPGTYIFTAESSGYSPARPLRITVVAQERKSVEIPMETSGGTSFAKSPPSGGATSAAAGDFYDETTFQPSPLTTSGEAAGYSSGSQGEVSHNLLADITNMPAGTVPDEAAKDIQSLFHPEGSAVGGRVLSSEECEGAVEREPTEANFFTWGDALLRQHAYRAAEEAFNHGIERYPTSLRLQLASGASQYLRGDYENAVSTFISAASSNPADSRPYILLGKAYSGASVPASDKALDTLRRFTQVQPQNALSHYYYALGLWKGVRGGNGNARRAEVQKAIERAVNQDPRLADAHLLLGSIYEEREMAAEAIAQYEQVTKLQPDLPAAHYRLSKLYLRQGDKTRADEELARFEKLTSPH